MIELEEYIGNKDAKQMLQKLLERFHNAQSDILHQVYLFYGAPGVGKSSHAAALAHQLVQSDQETHPDIFHLHVEGSGELHTVANIKQIIQDQALPPHQSAYKIYIIHDAHRMLPSSANLLLKTLEEPSATSLFFLISDQIEEILPTIRSRAVEIPFHAIPDDTLILYLEKRYDLTHTKAKRLALLSDGSVKASLALCEKNTEEELLEIVQIIKQTYLHNWAYVYSKLENFDKANLEDRLIISAFAFWFRDIQLLQAGADKSALFYSDYQGDLNECLSLAHPSMAKVNRALEAVYLSRERHTKMSRCIEYLLHVLIP